MAEARIDHRLMRHNTPKSHILRTGSAAYARLLAIPELLTMILLHLPFHDLLLRCPLVCRSWHELITASILLRQALFLHPLLDEPIYHIRQRDGHNALWSRSEDDTHCYTILYNPFWNPNASSTHAFKYPEASWRNMLFTQPASSAGRCRNCGVKMLSKNRAVRLGDVIICRCGKHVFGMHPNVAKPSGSVLPQIAGEVFGLRRRKLWWFTDDTLE